MMQHYVTPLLLRFVLFITFCFASLAYAQASALPPLSPTEFAAVIQEIKAMAKTDKNLADDFVVREATPSRIDRLYSMPEFIQQPKIIRENGLIFAGQGSLLTFDKPSDIITKVSSWFPEEVSAARAKNSWRFLTFLDLYGPYPSWKDEPAAFYALWNCMPQKAWLKPTHNPFMRRLNDHGPFAAIKHGFGEFDFGVCVREHSIRQQSIWTKGLVFPIEDRARQIGERVTPVLRSKFARFLSANRCQGTGPDDCVLILFLWSSLMPADIELAKAIQALEAEVSPDSPLPALQKPIDQYGSSNEEGEPRFDEGLRRAAFMRAKFLSVLNARNAWPEKALQTTLQQVILLQQKLNAANDFRWQYYYANISLHERILSPWYTIYLDKDNTSRLQAAIKAELAAIEKYAPCYFLKLWFKRGGDSETTYALQRLANKQPSRCASPDWAWLKQGKTADALDLRNKYLDLLGRGESGVVHEMLLSEFTDYGKNCFEQEDGPPPNWLRAVCKKWIAEPQTSPFTLKHSHLALKDEKKFRSTRLQVPTNPATLRQDAMSWLTKLAQGMNGEALKRMQAYAAALNQRDATINVATSWEHPRHDKSLIELQLSKSDLSTNEPGWPYRGLRVLLVLEPQTITIADIPDRFRGPYDHGQIVHVSDLDEDGNLEVWWAEAFRTCVGDVTDLERGLDCSAKMADMGEIKGDSLTYFANTPRTKQQPAMRNAQPSNPALMALVMPADVLDVQRPCNAVLIGAALGDGLGISFRERAQDGEVIDLVCKAHPLHPEQTIVALFHDLKDKQGEFVENQKGFVLAVIDAKRRILHSLYRDAIGEDATTRISQFSLQLDTARYNLAPGVRALGVRMNIGYGPRCAEGGESNYLSLFVEEGKQLKPVLKDLPMSMWTITEGSNGCGYSDTAYTMDSVALTLTLSATVTNGWRDLEVVAHHQIEAVEGANMVKQQPKTQVLGKLRANGKMYSGDYSWVRSRLWPNR